MLVWSANVGKPETGAVFYIEKLDVMRNSKVDIGYVLPVEFVAAE
jgi:hypothetical protein